MYQEINLGQKHGNGRKSEILDNFTDAKYLIKDDEVVIDIDSLDKKIIRQMILILDIKTQVRWTDKGAHVYFKYNSKLPSEKTCGLGFSVEYKKREVVVKRDNIEREIENEGVFEKLPKYFLPITTESVQDLVDGDGRYNKMFSLHSSLLRNQVDDREKVMRFVNDYILAEPLSEQQLKNAQSLSDDGVISYLEKTHDKVKYLLDKYHPVVYNGRLFFPIKGEFTNKELKIRAFIYEHFSNISTTTVDEILKQCLYKLGANEIMQEEIKVIKLKNGILKNGKYIDVDYKEFTPFNIELNYNESAKNEHIDRFMSLITDGDEQYERYLYKMVATSLILDFNVRRRDPRFHFIVGAGGEGKGTFLRLISKLFPIDMKTTVEPEQFDHTSHVYSLYGKLINLGDDVKDVPLKKDVLKIIKNVASCDEITIRENHGKSESNILVHPNLIFTSNHILSTWEKGDSIKRRIRWLPVGQKLKELSKSNSEELGVLLENIFKPQAIDYLFKRVVDEYITFEREGYNNVKLIDDFNEEYHNNNDNALIYLQDLQIDDILDSKPKTVYEEYEQWCESEDYSPVSKKRFSEQVKMKFEVIEKQKRIDGRNRRVYEKTK